MKQDKKEEEATPQIIQVEETTSTNSLLRELMAREHLAEESVVVADYQSAGRGQIGNKWESERGRNLTFSLVIYPTHVPANRQFLISQIAALSVKEALESYTDELTVKWPNDVYWRDKKICGMLIENDLSGNQLFSSIIGIGINLNQLIFFSDAPNPVSIFQITEEKVDREEALNLFQTIFHEYYTYLKMGDIERIRTNYWYALYRREGFYPYVDKGGMFEAEIEAVELTGHLRLRTRTGESRRYAFKEVACVLPQGNL